MSSIAAASVVKRLVDPVWLSKLIVSAYRVCGFSILMLILVGLTSYLSANVFYFVSDGWIEPTIVSPTDERILKLHSQHAQESASRDRLARDRLDMLARLQHEQRTLVMEEGFQASLVLALQADLAGNSAELGKLRGLLAQYDVAKDEILRSSQAYSGLSRERMADLHAARLIDQDALVNGSFQLSQIAHSNLTLREKKVDLDARIALLQRKVTSLGVAAGAASANEVGRARELSYEVLQIRHELEKSVVDAERARASVSTLEENVKGAEVTLARYDRLIQSIEEDPYLKAVDKNLHVAFVPYENLDRAAGGVPIYGCRLSFVWCRRVGQVTRMLAGEVQGKHPLRSQGLRGQMVQMQLADATWARHAVLHLGRAPLLF